MIALPILETRRLLLRPFVLADAADVSRLAGERDIAANTLSIPHPYDQTMAREWIVTHEAGFARGDGVVLAISERDTGALRGAIGLRLDVAHARAEMGYWVGKPYWGKGYCTEAARAVLRYAFDELGLNRVHAAHFSRNVASGRVLQKIGMTHEGRLREHVRKWGVFEDVEVYGITAQEWRVVEGARGGLER